MMVARANAQSEKNRPFVNRRLSQCGHRRLFAATCARSAI